MATHGPHSQRAAPVRRGRRHHQSRWCHRRRRPEALSRRPIPASRAALFDGSGALRGFVQVNSSTTRTFACCGTWETSKADRHVLSIVPAIPGG